MHTIQILASACTTVGVGANLLNAGNFESGTWGKWVLRPDGFHSTNGVTSPRYTGKYAGTHILKSTAGQVQITYPVVHLDANRQYQLSFDYKLLTKGCTSAITRGRGIIIEIGADFDTPKIGQWAKANASFIAQSLEDFTLTTVCDSFANINGTANAEFDNISLLPTGPQLYKTNTTTPTGPNVVSQPNFDSGTTKAYAVVNSIKDSARIVSGGFNGSAHALRINTTGFFDQSIQRVSIGATSVSQKVKTVRGQVYRYSVAIKQLQALGDDCGAEGFLSAGSLQDPQEAPYQIPFFYPPNDGKTPVPIGKWTTSTGFVTALSDKSLLVFTTQCVETTTVFDIGNIELVPVKALEQIT